MIRRGQQGRVSGPEKLRQRGRNKGRMKEKKNEKQTDHRAHGPKPFI